MKKSYEKMAAIFAITLVVASIFAVPALARSGEGSGSGSPGGGDGSMEDEIVGGDTIRGNGDENEIRGHDDENEIRGHDDENEIRGENEIEGPGDEPRREDRREDEIRGHDDEDEVRGHDDEDEVRGHDDEDEVRGHDDEDEEEITEIEIEDATGRPRIIIDVRNGGTLIRIRGNNDNDDGSCGNIRRGSGSRTDGPGERLEITSDSFNDSTEVKVKLDFFADSASNEDIANDILKRLELDSSEVDSLLVMDDDIEELVERTKVVVKEDNGRLRVKFEMRFPLDTDDRAAIVDEITAKLGSLEPGDVTPENEASFQTHSSLLNIQTNDRGFLNDLSDFMPGMFDPIFGSCSDSFCLMSRNGASGENEIRGNGNENEVRGHDDENEVRGHDDENEIRGHDDENEIRGENEIEGPGDEPRREDRREDEIRGNGRMKRTVIHWRR